MAKLKKGDKVKLDFSDYTDDINHRGKEHHLHGKHGVITDVEPAEHTKYGSVGGYKVKHDSGEDWVHHTRVTKLNEEKMANKKTLEIVEQIYAGKGGALRNTVNNTLSEKASTVLQGLKKIVAKDFFQGSNE